MTRRPSNSVNDRLSRWDLTRRRLRRWVRPVAWGAASLLVLASVALVLRSADPGGTVASLRERLGAAAALAGLRVTEVVIEGRANTPEPVLRAAIGVSPGDPILSFSVEQARQRIEQLSWIEEATVERRLPNTVVVSLRERRPFAIWQYQGRFAVIDRAGKIVDKQDPAQFRHLPLVVGEGAPAVAAALLDAIRDRPAFEGRVLAAVRVAQRRWNLRLRNGTDVMLPEGHEIAALDRLVQLQQTQALLDRPLAAIDLRLADKLIIRPRTDGRGEPAPAGAPAIPATSRKPI